MRESRGRDGGARWRSPEHIRATSIAAVALFVLCSCDAAATAALQRSGSVPAELSSCRGQRSTNVSTGAAVGRIATRGLLAPVEGESPSTGPALRAGHPSTLVLACDLPALKKPSFLKPFKLEMPALEEPPRVFKGVGGVSGGLLRLVPAKPSFGGAYASIIKAARDLTPNATLPVCKDLDFTSQLKGRFVKDAATGHLQYHLARCQPWRPAPPEALACLSGRHIAMVGDSLTRFQFISLARFLLHGRFQRPYDNDAEGLTVLAGPQPAVGRQLMHPGALGVGAKDGLQPPTEGPVTGLSPAAWERFFERTQKLLSRRGCANTTCRCYRNATDLSRAHEYWRVRLSLEDSSTLQLSMGLVYAIPDFATAGVNGLRWAFTAARRPPDVVVFNMGVWWGYVHSMHRPPDVSVGSVVTAFEEIFSFGARFVKQQGLSTRLVYKTTTPVMDAHNTKDNFWWMAWPTQIEPLLVPLARTYGWHVFDAREVVAAANRQGVQASWDAMHLFPFVYQELNDILLNMLCSASR